MPVHAPDPFYIIRQDIEDSVAETQQKLSRFHGLQHTNAERKTLSQQIGADCESIKWQLNEVVNAVEKASQDPQRFNLTREELSSRRQWITSTRQQVDGFKSTVRAATAAPPAATFEISTATPSKAEAEMDYFVASESERQTLIVRRQNEDLDDIEQAVSRIGRMGKAIGEELQGQDRLLNELDEDIDTTHTRLKVTSKKIVDMIKSTSRNTQLCLIVFLLAALVILSTLAFM